MSSSDILSVVACWYLTQGLCQTVAIKEQSLGPDSAPPEPRPMPTIESHLQKAFT